MNPELRIKHALGYHTVYIDKVPYRDNLYFVVTHHAESSQDVYQTWNAVVKPDGVTLDKLGGPVRYERPKK